MYKQSICRFLSVVIISALMTACASLPPQANRAADTAIKSDPSQSQYAKEVAVATAEHQGKSGFLTLPDGVEALAARLAIIEGAQVSLDVQYYIWHDDLVGKVLHNRLLAAADRGVKVRLLLDDLDTAGKDHLLAILDSHTNIEIRVFNPFANRNARWLDFLSSAKRVNHRMHNKSITADGVISILGGRNIGDEYFDAPADVAFSDLDVLAVGQVAQQVQQSFYLYWNSQWVYTLQQMVGGLAITDSEISHFRSNSDKYYAQAKSTGYALALDKVVQKKVVNTDVDSFTWAKWALVYDPPSKVGSNKVEDNFLAPRLKQAFNRAESDVVIVSPYFVPGDKLTQLLVAKVASGARVRIMTNSLAANDVPIVHSGYRRYRKDLLAGGVELYEFKPNASLAPETLKQKDKNQRIGSSSASLHGKYIGFDKRYIFIGSFNLDGRSTEINTELGVYFEAPNYAIYLSEIFDQRAIELAYKVELNDEGDLQWKTLDQGQIQLFNKEPETTMWQRFVDRILSPIVPEREL